MKYMYTICLVLSSFFIYKPLTADTNIEQNAFFIPGGAFQQNTQNIPQNIPSSRQKQLKNISATPSAPKKTQQSSQKIARETSPNQQTLPTKKQQERTQINTVESVPTTQQTAPKNIAQKTPNVKKQYTLDETITAPAPQKNAEKNIQLSSLEQFQQKSMKEMLNTLPYPDFNLPKYKQIYALYALELRSAYRRGKLPSNSEQEATLAKANSLRRFEVK